MTRLLPIATTMALMLGGTVAAAAELPTYEVLGFPITAHQFSLLGSANVHERTPAPALTLGGMPASPHQVAVLTPRPRLTPQQIVDELTKAGSVRSMSSVPSRQEVETRLKHLRPGIQEVP